MCGAYPEKEGGGKRRVIGREIRFLFRGAIHSTGHPEILNRLNRRTSLDGHPEPTRLTISAIAALRHETEPPSFFPVWRWENEKTAFDADQVDPDHKEYRERTATILARSATPESNFPCLPSTMTTKIIGRVRLFRESTYSK